MIDRLSFYRLSLCFPDKCYCIKNILQIVHSFKWKIISKEIGFDSKNDFGINDALL